MLLPLLCVLVIAAEAFHSTLRRPILPRLLSKKLVDGLENGLSLRSVGKELSVTELCLGCMNFGDQVYKDTSFQLLDTAVQKYGINFIDTAELYPLPAAQSTVGRSEKIVGSWMKKSRKQRSDIVISSKACGFSDSITWCRKGNQSTRVNFLQLEEAVDGILTRLGTDYIDILHIHWPERYVPLFGEPFYDTTDVHKDAESFQSQLEAVDRLLKSGKIRHYGLANETPYGITSFLRLADQLGIARPAILQNPYNLLARNDVEIGIEEIVYCEKLPLMVTSPLGGGSLSGKYVTAPAEQLMECRMYKFPGFMHRYTAPPATAAIKAYSELAETLSLPLTQVALAWVYSRPFVTSTVLGATSVSQLEENILSLNLPLNEEIVDKINTLFRSHQDPTKGVFEAIHPDIEEVDPATLPWGGQDKDIDPELDLLINQRLSNL